MWLKILTIQSVTTYWKRLSSLFLGFIVPFFNSVRRMNIWTIMFKIHFLTFILQRLTESKIKSLPLIDVLKSIWYLKRSDSKSSLTISFILSYDINSTLLLVECITRSSSASLEGIKLIAFFNLHCYCYFPCMRFLKINYCVWSRI